MSTKKLIKRPDHDPNNPYHYHDADGNKIVITPKDWEANVGKPYFREVEDAVRAEQAAYPEPEYEINPNFVRDLRSTYAGNMGYGYQNYRNFQHNLPQGYSFTPEGVIIGPDGTAYVQSGYRQTPRFTYSTDNPLQFTINQGKPIERNLTFYPVNMDKRIKNPLPVDRIINIDNEYNSAIDNYIKNNTTPKKKIHYINSSFVSFLHPELTTSDYKPEYNRAVKNAKKLGYRVLENYKPSQFNSFLIGFDDDEFNNWQKEMYDKFGHENGAEGEVWNDGTTLRETINGTARWSNGPNGPMGYQIRYEGGAPSRKEAEKKAVIQIGPLERVKSDKLGGKLIHKTIYEQN